jgi:hypothetical protein
VKVIAQMQRITSTASIEKGKENKMENSLANHLQHGKMNCFRKECFPEKKFSHFPSKRVSRKRLFMFLVGCHRPVALRHFINQQRVSVSSNIIVCGFRNSKKKTPQKDNFHFLFLSDNTQKNKANIFKVKARTLYVIFYFSFICFLFRFLICS